MGLVYDSALMIGFSVLAYTVGFNLRGNVSIVNRLTIARVWANTDLGQTQTLIGVQSPRRSTYTVNIERGFMLQPVLGTSMNPDMPVTISEATHFTAENMLIDAGMVGSFAANGYTTVPQLEATAIWHLSYANAPTIEVRIRNTTDVTLKNSVFLIKGISREVGASDTAMVYQVKSGSENIPLADLDPQTDLMSCNDSSSGSHCNSEQIAPGQVVLITAKLVERQDPGAFTLGNSWGEYYSTTYSYTTMTPYSYTLGSCFSQPVPITVQDVMLNRQFPCTLGDVSRDQQEVRRRYQLLGALIKDIDLSGGRGAGAYLFAWSDHPSVDVQLSGKTQNEEDTTLYIYELPITVVSDGSLVHVPSALTTWMSIETDDPNTITDVPPNPASGIQLSGNQQVAFQFRPMPEMRLATVDMLEITFDGYGPLSVQLWDWDQKIWRTIALDPNTDTTPVRDPAPFIGPENAVNLRVIPDNNVTYSSFQHVNVGFFGQIAQ
jgi:hypothetical protein